MSVLEFDIDLLPILHTKCSSMVNCPEGMDIRVVTAVYRHPVTNIYPALRTEVNAANQSPKKLR
jgi:hypothetical protein